jgi:hypothetical protein
MTHQIGAIEIKSMQRRKYLFQSLNALFGVGLQSPANPRYYPPKAEVVSSNLAGCANKKAKKLPEFWGF